MQRTLQTMKYPLETYVLGGKSSGWIRSSTQTPGDITHLFDPPDLLEEDDSLKTIPIWLSLQTERVRPVPSPFHS